MLSTIRRFFAQVRRARQAARLLRTAYALHAEERHSEAAATLRDVRAVADPPGNNWFLMGVQHMNRLRAATLTSIVAAKVGDEALAVEAIDEGLRLWREIKAHVKPGPGRQQLNEWEAWANAYVASRQGD